MEVTSTTTPLTAANMPKGTMWEMDGACWVAVRSITNPDQWWWRARNGVARNKANPTGDMFDHYPIVKLPKRYREKAQ